MNFVKTTKETFEEYGVDITTERLLDDGEYIKHFELSSEIWLKMKDDVRVEFLTQSEVDVYTQLQNSEEVDVELFRQFAIKKANKYFAVIGEQGFYSDCLGEMTKFASDKDSRDMIMGQYATALGNERRVAQGKEPLMIRWKTFDQPVCDVWADEAMIKLGEDLQQAIQQLVYNQEMTVALLRQVQTVAEMQVILGGLS